MSRNRLLESAPVYRLPQPPALPPSPQAFVLVPVPALVPGLTFEQMLWQRWLYQQAWEQAQAAARPSLPERDLLGVWN
jgi:hypothetical protein